MPMQLPPHHWSGMKRLPSEVGCQERVMLRLCAEAKMSHIFG